MSTPDEPAVSDVELKCADCGYDLRGLMTDGTCPECGLSIVESLTTRRSFTRHQLAVLACRVLALWVLVHAGLYLTTFAQAVLWTVTDVVGGNIPATSVLGFIAGILPLLANVAIAVLLWFLSPWIAKRIFSENAPVRIGSRAGTWDILPLVPLSMGVVFVALGLRSIVHVAGASVIGVSDPRMTHTLSAIAYTLVGLVLLVGGPAMIRGIKWLRTAGQTTPST